MKKIKNRTFRCFVVVFLAGERQQYAAFLLLWYFFLAVQSILRTLSACLALLFVVADLQELALRNFEVILKQGFYSTLSYAIISILLFLVAPGSHILQGFQEYLKGCRYPGHMEQIINQVKLQYRLWIRLPLRSILYLLEVGLALAWAALLYILALAQGFSVM